MSTLFPLVHFIGVTVVVPTSLQSKSLSFDKLYVFASLDCINILGGCDGYLLYASCAPSIFIDDFFKVTDVSKISSRDAMQNSISVIS